MKNLFRPLILGCVLIAITAGVSRFAYNAYGALPTFMGIVASGNGSPAGSTEFLLYADAAKTKAIYADSAKTKQIITRSTHPPAVEGGFDSAVIDTTQSFVTDPTSPTPTVTVQPFISPPSTVTTPGGAWGWWYFRLANFNGKTPLININVAHSDHGASTRALYSYDRVTWTPFDNSSIINNVQTITNNTPFTSDTVYVAWIEPFTTFEYERWLAANDSSPYMHELPSSIAYAHAKYQFATTHQGIPQYAFRISDDTQHPAGGGAKKRVIVFGGTHACEIPGSQAAVGMADFLLSSDPVAINLRKEFEFWFDLITVPETRYFGYYRFTYEEQLDPNRQIPNVSTGPGHEMANVIAAVGNDFGVNGPVWFGLDFHSGTPIPSSVSALHNGYTLPDEPLHTQLVNALRVYIPDWIDLGTLNAGSAYLWMHDVLGAKYSATLETATVNVHSLADMRGYGVDGAKLVEDLFLAQSDVTSLQDVEPSTVFDVDATQADSYPGTGQTLVNLVENPADGVGHNSYDFWLGNSGATSSVDPTFNGTPGTPGAYFALDGGDYFTLKSGTNTGFLNSLGLTTGGSDWWAAFAVHTPVDDATSDGFFSTRTTSTQVGLSLTQDTNEHIASRQSSPTTGITATGTATLPTSSDVIVIVSYSHSTNNLRIWANSNTHEDIAQTYITSTTNPGAALRLMAGSGSPEFLWESGAQFKSAAMGNVYLDDTKETALRAAIAARH